MRTRIIIATIMALLMAVPTMAQVHNKHAVSKVLLQKADSVSDKEDLLEKADSLMPHLPAPLQGRLMRQEFMSKKADSLVMATINAMKIPDFRQADYFSCAVYNKSSMALNDVDLFNTDTKFFKKHPRLRETVEKNSLNNKFVLPLMSEQKVTQLLWRKNPQKEIHNVLAINREYLGEVVDADAILEAIFGKQFLYFTIYDDTIEIDKTSCYSPVGKHALEHYDYEIEHCNDTAATILFDPKTKYPDGMTGYMTIIKDTTQAWRVKLVVFSLPIKRHYHHIENLYISQEYAVTPDGYSVIFRDDYIVELQKNKTLGQLCYISSEQYSHYSTDSLPDKTFKHKAKLRYDGMAEYREPSYWVEYDRDLSSQLQSYRTDDSLHCSQTVENGQNVVKHHQTYSQKRINEILDIGGRNKWVRPAAVTMKSLINNYIEIGNPPYFDIEPVVSLISYNDVDKWRFRFGGNTTANFNRQFFYGGYVAYGTSSRNVYYQAKGTYSFLPKTYEASEFPRRNINIESRYDICYLGERNTHTDHDNIFKSYRWDKNTKMMFFKLQSIGFERDERNGFGYRFNIKREEDQATGGLIFKSMHDLIQRYGVNSVEQLWTEHGGTLDNGSVCTTELRFEFLYSPRNLRFKSSKPRVPDNNEMPSLALAHTIGVKMFGGKYSYHLTEMKVTKDWYLGSLGIAHSLVKAGAVWNTVPYPLLLAPPANISYVIDQESFSLISTSGFVNDKYVQAMFSWETNGNVIGLVPIIKKLRWKEYLAVRMLWGGLSDKNNPNVFENYDSRVLMPLPKDVYVMNQKIPYVEGVVGIHNILHIIDVDYIYRFTYRDLPNAKLGGIRFYMHFNF